MLKTVKIKLNLDQPTLNGFSLTPAVALWTGLSSLTSLFSLDAKSSPEKHVINRVLLIHKINVESKSQGKYHHPCLIVQQRI